jgi:hypothetical protein
MRPLISLPSLLVVILAFTAAGGYAANLQPDFKAYKTLSPSDRAILKKLGVEKQANQDKAAMHAAGSLDMFSLEVAKVQINTDGKADYIVRSCGGAYYGLAGCQVALYASSPGNWQNLGGVPAISVVFPGSRTKGYLDHYYEGPGFQKPHIWKWNGHQYR